MCTAVQRGLACEGCCRSGWAFWSESSSIAPGSLPSATLTKGELKPARRHTCGAHARPNALEWRNKRAIRAGSDTPAVAEHGDSNHSFA
jgi:hypothetical protein